jgi:hypothetical protein
MHASTMSSETSTEERAAARASSSFEPWQLFTLAGLISAAIVAFFAKAQAPPARIFLILTIFAAAAVGVGALRMLLPLVGISSRERHTSLSERTRAVLEREKALALRSIKELEFDRAMGKVSESDYHDLSARLRVRAGRLLRELDSTATSPYRDAIEKELARRLGPTPTSTSTLTPPSAATPASTTSPAAVVCAACATTNDTDARFCKGCGARLEAA